ncbi:hypothetical protein QWY87_13800 [Lutimonas halocynthiae]|uniref:O-antigen ligase family protein n=1 Tax=Lutimonas halocynthiae TaxID=1446477 RepID=UPI0025B2B790|nr:O-antigen ligase family protein [Lutimonas halocynthiae]MDN3643786.1 hypothetical protein [Lutimonas halocynthiae]
MNNSIKIEKIVDKSNSNDFMQILAISIFVAFPAVDFFVNNQLDIAIWDSLLTKGILYGSILLGWLMSLKKISGLKLFFPFFLLILIFLSYFLTDNPNQENSFTILISIITLSIPLYYIVISIEDFDNLYTYLTYSSCIAICFGFFTVYSYSLLYNDRVFPYMAFSNQILFPIVFLIFSYGRIRKWLSLLFIFTGVLLVFIYGSRGAQLSIILSIIVSFMVFFKPTLKTIGLILTIIILIFFIDISLDNINLVLIDMDVYSRSISLLLNDDITNTSGRDMLYDSVVNLIYDNPFGKGFFYTGDLFTGSYSHNIILDFFLHFGIVLGSLLLFLLLMLSLKKIFQFNLFIDSIFFMSIFFSVGFVKMLFSSTYLSEPFFFILIALLININKNRKHSLNEKYS